MSAVVRFAPELGAWISRQLDDGHAPAALAAAMQERRIEPSVAQAIVGAFVRARRDGTAPPADAAVAMSTARPFPQAADAQDAASPGDHAHGAERQGAVVNRGDARSGDEYVADPSRHPLAAFIETFDRRVAVVARAERPSLAVLADVMSADECVALIALARGRLQPSTIADPASGKDVVAATRASSGMFFKPQEHPLVARLDRRFAELMGLPVAQGEGLQVLHYAEGAGSEPHFDFLVPSSAANRNSIERSGQRVATVVAYLNDVPAGGETVFPAVGLSVVPRRGQAVAFEYANRAGSVDPASLHASAAVRSGEKWVATKWLRAGPFVSA